MKTTGFIVISFKGVDYKINIKKLQIVFSVLESRKTVLKSEAQIKDLLKKYKLYDKGFFENVNKI